MLLLVLSFALLTAASFFLLRATNGGENDTVVAVEVRALSVFITGNLRRLCQVVAVRESICAVSQVPDMSQG